MPAPALLASPPPVDAEAGAACAAALDALGLALPPRDALWVLSHIATERRLLLVGDPGQGKTLLARRLGQALAGERVACLDAALTSFDDVRGFVRPASLDQGLVEIVPGPWSPYDAEFLFVDELSRASPWQQGRWLQLVHERRVDGRPTAIRWVLCAMNPAGSEGVAPLALALADRFHAVVELTPYGRLSEAQRLRIAAGLEAPTARDLEVARALAARIVEGTRAVAADTPTRLRFARVAAGAVQQFNAAARGARSPLQLHGRRVVHLRESMETLAGALIAESGCSVEDAAAGLRARLRDAVAVGLGGVVRAADRDLDRLDAALDAAWRGALAAWDDAYDARGEVDPLTARLALMELEHPRLPCLESVRLLHGWWLEAAGAPEGVAPVAVLQPTSEGEATSAADAFLPQLRTRPAFTVPLEAVPEAMRASLPAPVRSTALHRQFSLCARGGVYHPALTVLDSTPPDGDVVVFALPSAAWRALVDTASVSPVAPKRRRA